MSQTFYEACRREARDGVAKSATADRMTADELYEAAEQYSQLTQEIDNIKERRGRLGDRINKAVKATGHSALIVIVPGGRVVYRVYAASPDGAAHPAGDVVLAGDK